jgi:peptidoglycan lytic transglycosylase G
MRRLALLLTVAVAGLASTMAPAATEPALKISFPEGWSARQMADRAAEVRLIAIRKRGVTPRLSGASYAAATRAARAPASFRPFLKRRSVEGFLFPSTYFFEPSSSAASLVARQIETFQQRWASIDLRAAKARKRTPYDVLIIASLIEKETVASSERALVAAVIENRLEQGMPLAIDASLRYGLGVQGTRPLKQSHFRSDTPYNTHRFKGLPPTPITNPGLPSMRAAAKPANVDYLYYVRKPDGVHHFFTADEAEFCAKAVEYGYPGC